MNELKFHWSYHFLKLDMPFVLRHLTKRAITPIYDKTNYVQIISLGWPWPSLTLFRTCDPISGEHFRFSSCFCYVSLSPFYLSFWNVVKCGEWRIELPIHFSFFSNSSLQCYSVLSTIAQVLRKMSLKILASWFLMPYLSQTFESHQRVKMSTYSVNDLGLKKFLH